MKIRFGNPLKNHVNILASIILPNTVGDQQSFPYLQFNHDRIFEKCQNATGGNQFSHIQIYGKWVVPITYFAISSTAHQKIFIDAPKVNEQLMPPQNTGIGAFDFSADSHYLKYNFNFYNVNELLFFNNDCSYLTLAADDFESFVITEKSNNLSYIEAKYIEHDGSLLIDNGRYSWTISEFGIT